MGIILHFEAEYEAVYSVNGVFLENAVRIRYEEGQTIYVTVFPLQAQLLPYTAKLIGGKVVANKELCQSFALPQNNYYIRLSPRHNYVYSPISQGNIAHKGTLSTGVVPSFYTKVKLGDIAYARTMMTQELNSCIEDDGLMAFFGEFVDIVPNKFLQGPDNSYFLIDSSGNSQMFVFDLIDGLIDNIRQSE